MGAKFYGIIASKVYYARLMQQYHMINMKKCNSVEKIAQNK